MRSCPFHWPQQWWQQWGDFFVEGRHSASISALWWNYYHELLRANSISAKDVHSIWSLEYLNSLGFTWTEMSVLLGVSRMTIYRRRRDYGMLDDSVHPISDRELRDILRNMRLQHPNYGETMAMGHIRSLGYRISRARLRASIHDTDSIQAALRWQGGPVIRPNFVVAHWCVPFLYIQWEPSMATIFSFSSPPASIKNIRFIWPLFFCTCAVCVLWQRFMALSCPF